MPKHLICQQPITFKNVIDDYGNNVLIAWCESCQQGLNTEDCDGPIPFDDVPDELLAQFIAGHVADRGTKQ